MFKKPSIQFRSPTLCLNKLQNLFCDRAASQILTPLIDKVKNIVRPQTDDVQRRPESRNVFEKRRKKWSTFSDKIAIGETELTKRRKDDVCDVERETIIFVGRQSFGLNPI